MTRSSSKMIKIRIHIESPIFCFLVVLTNILYLFHTKADSMEYSIEKISRVCSDIVKGKSIKRGDKFKQLNNN